MPPMAGHLHEVPVPPDKPPGDPSWAWLRQYLRKMARMDSLDERWGIIVFLSSSQQPDRRSLRCNGDSRCEWRVRCQLVSRGQQNFFVIRTIKGRAPRHTCGLVSPSEEDEEQSWEEEDDKTEGGEDEEMEEELEDVNTVVQALFQLHTSAPPSRPEEQAAAQAVHASDSVSLASGGISDLADESSRQSDSPLPPDMMMDVVERSGSGKLPPPAPTAPVKPSLDDIKPNPAELHTSSVAAAGGGLLEPGKLPPPPPPAPVQPPKQSWNDINLTFALLHNSTYDYSGSLGHMRLPRTPPKIKLEAEEVQFYDVYAEAFRRTLQSLGSTQARVIVQPAQRCLLLLLRICRGIGVRSREQFVTNKRGAIKLDFQECPQLQAFGTMNWTLADHLAIRYHYRTALRQVLRDWRQVQVWPLETIRIVELRVDVAAFDNHDTRAPKARPMRDMLVQEQYLAPSRDGITAEVLCDPSPKPSHVNGITGEVLFDPSPKPSHANGRLYTLLAALYLRVLSRTPASWSSVVNPDFSPLAPPPSPVVVIMHPQVFIYMMHFIDLLDRIEPELGDLDNLGIETEAEGRREKRLEDVQRQQKQLEQKQPPPRPLQQQQQQQPPPPQLEMPPVKEIMVAGKSEEEEEAQEPVEMVVASPPPSPGPVKDEAAQPPATTAAAEQPLKGETTEAGGLPSDVPVLFFLPPFPVNDTEHRDLWLFEGMYLLVPGPATEVLIYERPGDVFIRGPSEDEARGKRWYTTLQYQPLKSSEGPGSGRLAVHDCVNKGNDLQRPARRLHFRADDKTIIKAEDSVASLGSEEVLARLREKMQPLTRQELTPGWLCEWHAKYSAPFRVPVKTDGAGDAKGGGTDCCNLLTAGDVAALAMAQRYWQGDNPEGLWATQHPPALEIPQSLERRLLPALLGDGLARLAMDNVLNSSENHRTGTFELTDFISFVNAFGQGGTLVQTATDFIENEWQSLRRQLEAYGPRLLSLPEARGLPAAGPTQQVYFRLSTSLPSRAVFHAYLSPQPRPAPGQSVVAMFMYIEIDPEKKVIRFHEPKLKEVLDDYSAAEMIEFFEKTPSDSDAHSLYNDFMTVCQSMYEPRTKYRRRTNSGRGR